MNKISKILITAAFAVGMVAIGAAQAAGPKGGQQGKGGEAGKARQGGPGGGGMRRGMNMFNNPEIEKRLKITPDQKKKLEAAGKEMQASMQKLMQGKDFRSMSEADRTALRGKMKPISDKFQAVVDKTLTATQKKEMEKIRAEFMQRGGNRGGDGKAGAGKAGAGKAGGGGKAKGGGGL